MWLATSPPRCVTRPRDLDIRPGLDDPGSPDAPSAGAGHHGAVTDQTTSASVPTEPTRSGGSATTLAESPEPSAPAPLPPDPVAYDDPRNVQARARGLPAPYISGGLDPDPAKGLREERYYGRLLVYMVVGLVLGGFVIGLVIAVAMNA
jgi:hypothetical protein